MTAIDQQFIQLNDLSEVDNLFEELDGGSQDYVNTEISDFLDQECDFNSKERSHSNHSNHSNGVDSEYAMSMIFGIGPAITNGNEAPDLIHSESGRFCDEKVAVEVKSCDVGYTRNNRIRQGSYNIPLDTHENLKSKDSYDGLKYIMTSRISNGESQHFSAAVLGFQDIDMLVSNDDLPCISRYIDKGRPYLEVEEPLVNRVAKFYNHSRYPDVDEGYSDELEDDFRKSFDRETVEYWFEHPENSLKSQRKYEA